LSFLSGQYGLVCDNVANYEIVLANGSVVDANETSNPDLFFALKGGGNQFGKSPVVQHGRSLISTRYRYEVYHEDSSHLTGPFESLYFMIVLELTTLEILGWYPLLCRNRSRGPHQGHPRLDGELQRSLDSRYCDLRNSH
jgi:hypothetical protein